MNRYANINRFRKLHDLNDIKIRLIFSATEDGGIGFNGDMPWGKELKNDLKRFKEFTKQSGHVVMGSKTLRSINGGSGLPDRCNWVITKDQYFFGDGEESLFVIDSYVPVKIIRRIYDAFGETVKTVDIIGGSKVIEAFAPYADEVLFTLVSRTDGVPIECDTFVDLKKVIPFKHVLKTEKIVEGSYQTTFTHFIKEEKQDIYTPTTVSVDYEAIKEISDMLAKYRSFADMIYDQELKKLTNPDASAAVNKHANETKTLISQMRAYLNSISEWDNK